VPILTTVFYGMYVVIGDAGTKTMTSMMMSSPSTDYHDSTGESRVTAAVTSFDDGSVVVTSSLTSHSGDVTSAADDTQSPSNDVRTPQVVMTTAGADVSIYESDATVYQRQSSQQPISSVDSTLSQSPESAASISNAMMTPQVSVSSRPDEVFTGSTDGDDGRSTGTESMLPSPPSATTIAQSPSNETATSRIAMTTGVRDDLENISSSSSEVTYTCCQSDATATVTSDTVVMVTGTDGESFVTSPATYTSQSGLSAGTSESVANVVPRNDTMTSQVVMTTSSFTSDEFAGVKDNISSLTTATSQTPNNITFPPASTNNNLVTPSTVVMTTANDTAQFLSSSVASAALYHRSTTKTIPVRDNTLLSNKTTTSHDALTTRMPNNMHSESTEVYSSKITANYTSLKPENSTYSSASPSDEDGMTSHTVVMETISDTEPFVTLPRESLTSRYKPMVTTVPSVGDTSPSSITEMPGVTMKTNIIVTNESTVTIHYMGTIRKSDNTTALASSPSNEVVPSDKVVMATTTEDEAPVTSPPTYSRQYAPAAVTTSDFVSLRNETVASGVVMTTSNSIDVVTSYRPSVDVKTASDTEPFITSSSTRFSPHYELSTSSSQSVGGISTSNDMTTVTSHVTMRTSSVDSFRNSSITPTGSLSGSALTSPQSTMRIDHTVSEAPVSQLSNASAVVPSDVDRTASASNETSSSLTTVTGSTAMPLSTVDIVGTRASTPTTSDFWVTEITDRHSSDMSDDVIHSSMSSAVSGKIQQSTSQQLNGSVTSTALVSTDTATNATKFGTNLHSVTEPSSSLSSDVAMATTIAPTSSVPTELLLVGSVTSAYTEATSGSSRSQKSSEANMLMTSPLAITTSADDPATGKHYNESTTDDTTSTVSTLQSSMLPSSDDMTSAVAMTTTTGVVPATTPKDNQYLSEVITTESYQQSTGYSGELSTSPSNGVAMTTSATVTSTNRPTTTMTSAAQSSTRGVWSQSTPFTLLVNMTTPPKRVTSRRTAMTSQSVDTSSTLISDDVTRSQSTTRTSLVTSSSSHLVTTVHPTSSVVSSLSSPFTSRTLATSTTAVRSSSAAATSSPHLVTSYMTSSSAVAMTTRTSTTAHHVTTTRDRSTRETTSDAGKFPSSSPRATSSPVVMTTMTSSLVSVPTTTSHATSQPRVPGRLFLSII